MRPRWTPRASRDLDEIGAYIAQDDPAAAGRVLDLIVKSTRRLVDHPTIGRVGRVAGTRELAIAGSRSSLSIGSATGPSTLSPSFTAPGRGPRHSEP